MTLLATVTYIGRFLIEELSSGCRCRPGWSNLWTMTLVSNSKRMLKVNSFMFLIVIFMRSEGVAKGFVGKCGTAKTMV